MTSGWIEVAPSPRPAQRDSWPREALSLLLLRRPARPPRALGIGVFGIVGALFLLGGALVDDLLIDTPRWPNLWAVTERSFPLLLALSLAHAVAALLHRSAIGWRLASVGLMAVAPALWLWPWLSEQLADESAWRWAVWIYPSLLVLQTVRWAQADAPRWQRLAAQSLAVGALLATLQWLPYSPWWWADDSEDDSAYSEPEQPDWSAEQLWNRQPELLDGALAQLAAQRPGKIDLYALGMAGDGSESVFRNEIDYLENLLAQRFDAPGRMLALVNHPDTRDSRPLASVSNLRAALDGIGNTMDRDEDILLLFVASHGSEDHRVYLGLDPLPLDPLSPELLREALDDAGIRWRVLVISSCYSGGFVDALQGPETLVITAARADRPSFGCGSQSDITWFGQAFLVDALNQSTDLFEAFRQAKALIREREREEDERPSYPQIARGAQIGRKLDAWRSSLAPAAPVPFQATAE